MLADRELTTAEAAEYLDLHVTRVRLLTRQGRIPARETVRGRVYRLADLAKFKRIERRPGRPRDES